jgi:myo-inositol 2-dehydrogenase/D-chiro-inositol 1-dehydrogenase
VLVDPAIGEAGDVDTAIVTLRYASGALGSIDNSRQAVYGYDQRVEVFGSEGCVVVSNVAPTTAVLSRADGVSADTPLHFFVERYEAAYVAEMQDFVDCLLDGRPPSVTGQDARVPVVMALAAQRSRQERTPVRL